MRVCIGIACIALSAGAASASGLEGLTQFGDLGQAIAATIIFLLLLGLLGRYAWKPLVTQLQRREQSIADTLAQAQQRQKAAEDALAEYRKRLDAVEAEAQDLLAKARQEAVASREQVLAAAREDARVCGESMLAEIDQAKRAALQELHESTANLAADMAGRVLGRAMKPEDHKNLLALAMQDLRQNMPKDN